MLINTRTTLDKHTLEDLSHYLPHRRQEAEERLASLGPNAADVLINCVEDETYIHRRSRILSVIMGLFLMVGLVVVVILSSILVLAVFILSLVMMSDFHLNPEWIPLHGFDAIEENYFRRRPFSVAHRNALVALAKYDNVRALPVLLKAYAVYNTGIETECYSAIMRLCGKVTEQDSALFSPADRILLRNALSDPDSHFVCSILGVITKIGDEADIPALKNLTQLPVYSVGNKRVPVQAQKTLEAIKQRLVRKQEAQTLLRASGLNDPAEMLLRPQHSSPQEPANQLLHPLQDSTRKE